MCRRARRSRLRRKRAAGQHATPHARGANAERDGGVAPARDGRRGGLAVAWGIAITGRLALAGRLAGPGALAGSGAAEREPPAGGQPVGVAVAEPDSPLDRRAALAGVRNVAHSEGGEATCLPSLTVEPASRPTHHGGRASGDAR